MNVLVLNAGSSSLKFQLIATDLDRMRDDHDQRLLRGSIDSFGTDAEIEISAGESERKTRANVPDIAAAIDKVLEEAGELAPPDAVGHRVVHGGERFSESCLVTEDVLEDIQQCVAYAPLHNPSNLAGMHRIRERFGAQMPQVAVFDTAFHHSLPEHAFLYAIPYEVYEKHRIRRYGFHGTSHRYVAHRYRQLRNLSREQTNIITIHLGNGCSAAAIKNGRSMDTSMGMTPLEGLMMGTRSGDVDASLVTLISERERIDCAAVEKLLNDASGLRGVSGISNDMRELQRDSGKRAALAIEMFCYRVRKYIGSYLAAMGGADALVFTGGIGEHSPKVREMICQRLAWAGLHWDSEANAKNADLLSTADSELLAYRIPTDEELLIARDTVRTILNVPHPS